VRARIGTPETIYPVESLCTYGVHNCVVSGMHKNTSFWFSTEGSQNFVSSKQTYYASPHWSPPNWQGYNFLGHPSFCLRKLFLKRSPFVLYFLTIIGEKTSSLRFWRNFWKHIVLRAYVHNSALRVEPTSSSTTGCTSRYQRIPTSSTIASYSVRQTFVIRQLRTRSFLLGTVEEHIKRTLE
jgi:hypothetical protein